MPMRLREEADSRSDASTTDSDWMLDLAGFLGVSIGLFSILGIRLRVHLSFVVGVAIYLGWAWNYDGSRGVLFVGYFIAVSTVSVVLHELGHAWMARRFQILASRIVVFLGGAFVLLEEIPRNSRVEFLIAVAGPAVNFGIALLLYPVEQWLTAAIPPRWGLHPSDFVEAVILINVGMGCCNLLPIFPMDGGRALRACLALNMSYRMATLAAVTVGKAVGIVVLGYVIFEMPHNVFQYLYAVVVLAVLACGELEYQILKYEEEGEEGLE